MTTAEKLKQIRIEHGYSLDKMAQLLGYSRTHYSKMERGEYNPPADLLDKLAALPSPETTGFTERFIQLRKERGTTLVQFAEFIGMSRASLCRIENGSAFPNDRQLIKIVETCGVGADWLLYGNNSRKDYPLTDQIIEFFWDEPELRKLIWEKYRNKHTGSEQPE